MAGGAGCGSALGGEELGVDGRRRGGGSAPHAERSVMEIPLAARAPHQYRHRPRHVVTLDVRPATAGLARYRHALTDGSGRGSEEPIEFTTSPARFVYTTAGTGGCSCEQTLGLAESVRRSERQRKSARDRRWRTSSRSGGGERTRCRKTRESRSSEGGRETFLLVGSLASTRHSERSDQVGIGKTEHRVHENSLHRLGQVLVGELVAPFEIGRKERGERAERRACKCRAAGR